MSYNESLLPNSNYPPMSQSEWDNAPWNQSSPKPKEIEVTVSITLSKTMKIEVDDYIYDEDGDIDYSTCDLQEAVRNQVTLPDDAYEKLHHAVYMVDDHNAHNTLEDLKDWETDDFAVIIE